ncbi:MAG: Methyl-accepting chemotaxis sensor/transducer protein, partial [uncultured Blastococcus sp.]
GRHHRGGGRDRGDQRDRGADLRPADHHRLRGGGADGHHQRDVPVGAGGRGWDDGDRQQHHRRLHRRRLHHPGAGPDPHRRRRAVPHGRRSADHGRKVHLL